MRTIAALWESYNKEVVPATASPIQRQELRRAFYAGAGSMMGLVYDLGDDSISEDAGIAVMQGLVDEAHAFKNAVLAGQA
jgi:hypothetical protein